MYNPIANLSMRKASMTVGIGLIIMMPLALFADSTLLGFFVSGDAAATTANIQANQLLFGLSVAGYVLILVIDVLIALALYVILKPVNQRLSALTAALRLTYVAIMVVGLFALVMLYSDGYVYGKLLAYVFFISHLFVLGYLVYKSTYIPRSLGVFLMIASLSYIILLYGQYIFSPETMGVLTLIAMVPALFAELSLGLWLLFKGGKVSVSRDQNPTQA